MIDKFGIHGVAAAVSAAVLLTSCVSVEPDTVPANGGAGAGGLASGGQIGGGGTGLGGQSGQNTGGTGLVGGAGAGGLGGSGGGAGAGGSGGGTSGTGTGGSGFEIVPPEPTFRMVKFVLQSTQEPCVASDCHGLNTENILELAIDERLYTTLTTHISVNCGNIPVVTPGDVTRSALAKILRGPCGETPRMPRDCVDDPLFNTCVYPEYLDAIDQWITMGAPQ